MHGLQFPNQINRLDPRTRLSLRISRSRSILENPLPPSPTFAERLHDILPSGDLTLASDLRVPIGFVRRLCKPQAPPEDGVWFQLDAVLASRSPEPADGLGQLPSGVALVQPAVLARPLLYLPVRVAALRAAWASRVAGNAGRPSLSELLWPRPPGHPMRVPITPRAPLRSPALLQPARGLSKTSQAQLRAWLREHPAERERFVRGGLVLGRQTARGSRLQLAEQASSVARPLSLVSELMLLCPSGHQEAGLRGAPSVAARLVRDLYEAEAAAGRLPKPLARGARWRDVGPHCSEDDRLAGLRTEAIRELRSLIPRADRRRLRSVQAFLVPELRVAPRPVRRSLLWRWRVRGAAGSAASLAATAELMRDALRLSDWSGALAVAADGAGAHIWTPEGGTAEWVASARHDSFRVAQVVVTPSDPLYDRARGAMGIPDPRLSGRVAWRAAWGCPERRAAADAEADGQPVVGVVGGVGANGEAVVRRWLGAGAWPVTELVGGG